MCIRDRVKVGGEKTPGIVKVNATDYTLDTSGKADMTIKGTSKYDVTGNLEVKGTNTTIEGTTQVEIKNSGGANIKLLGNLIYLN